MKIVKIIIISILVTLTVVLLYLRFYLADKVYLERNRVLGVGDRKPSADALKLYEKLFVGDLHQDVLLWQKDFLKDENIGHLDLPRMQKANVGLQIFSVVTSVPKDANYDTNPRGPDSINLLAAGQWWPVNSWFDPFNRALYQADRFHDYVSRSDQKLVPIESRADLEKFVRERRPGQVGAFLSLEGLYPAEDLGVKALDVLIDRGYRMFALSHMSDSYFGGSAHGEKKMGLTEKGREIVEHLKQKGMVIDLAHASDALIDDLLKIEGLKLVYSHAGLREVCNTPRNLSDERLKQLGERGILIGVGFWKRVICGEEVERIGRAIKHAIKLAGVENVALGSDFEGSVAIPFDVTGLPILVDELLQQGLTEDQITKVFGQNQLQFFLKNLPE